MNNNTYNHVNNNEINNYRSFISNATTAYINNYTNDTVYLQLEYRSLEACWLHLEGHLLRSYSC